MNIYHKCGQIVREIKNKKLKPAGKFIKTELKLSSNSLSLIGLIAGVSSAFFMFGKHEVFIPLILITIFADVFDGVVARLEPRKKYGWLIDAICDRLVTTSLLVSMLVHYDFSRWMLLILAIYVLTSIFILHERVKLKGKKAIRLDASAYILFIFEIFYIGQLLIIASAVVSFFIFLFKSLTRKKTKVSGEFTYANAITFFRTSMVIIALILLKDFPILLAVVIGLGILLDGADGYLARHRGSSKFGALADILGDRVVETVILFAYAHWGLISYAFPVIFLVRGMTTDFIRVLNTIYPTAEYAHPLQLGKAINRFARVISGLSKLLAFITILFWPILGFWMIIVNNNNFIIIVRLR